MNAKNVNVVICLSLVVTLVSCAPPSHRGKQEPGGQGGTENKLSPTLQSIQTGFVDKKCVSCHSQPTERNRYVALADLALVVEGSGHSSEQGGLRKLIKPGCPNESFFLSVLKKGDMPPAPGERTSTETLKAIEDWVVSLKPDAGETCNDEPPD